jgi:hypothetical protein
MANTIDVVTSDTQLATKSFCLFIASLLSALPEANDPIQFNVKA